MKAQSFLEYACMVKELCLLAETKLFAILKLVRLTRQEAAGILFLSWLFLLSAAPYISFRPDHPQNPSYPDHGNATGSCLKQNAFAMEELHKEDTVSNKHSDARNVKLNSPYNPAVLYHRVKTECYNP